MRSKTTHMEPDVCMILRTVLLEICILRDVISHRKSLYMHNNRQNGCSLGFGDTKWVTHVVTLYGMGSQAGGNKQVAGIATTSRSKVSTCPTSSE
ncbi:unnamed protein product [Caretta caretta]